jgi:phospholipid transport system transporter-binding protein
MPNPKNNTASLEQTGNGQFKVRGELDFQTVPAVWEKSQRLFADSASIAVDLAGVQRSNSAGLALLIQWMRYADTHDKRIAFHHIPEQMHEIARVCGVDNYLPVSTVTS